MCREFMRGACKRAESECRFAHPQESVSSHEDGSVTVCMDAVKGRCAREPCRYFHPPLHLQAQIKAAQTRATAVWLYYFNPQIPITKQTKKSTKKTMKFLFRFLCSVFFSFRLRSFRFFSFFVYFFFLLILCVLVRFPNPCSTLRWRFQFFIGVVWFSRMCIG